MEKFIKQEVFFEVGDVKVEVTCHIPVDADFRIDMDALAEELEWKFQNIRYDPNLSREANNHLGI